MITMFHLEKFKQQNISDVELDKLTDISNVVIDENKCTAERVYSFIEQVGNPYLFKVGNTPVKISFPPNAPTIQECLETLFTKNI